MSAGAPSRAEAPSRAGAARSLLFTPGTRPERFAKAVASGADLVILDLEDAVAPADRPAAREHIAAFFAEHEPTAIRINAPADQAAGRGVFRPGGLADESSRPENSTEGADDHTADLVMLRALPRPPAAVMVPKAEDPTVLEAVAEAADAPVIALVESAAGLRRIDEIAAHPAVVRLAIGHLDLAVDIGCQPSPTAMLHPRMELVIASRLAQLPAPIDGVTAAFSDDAALSVDLEHAVELGFGGKLVIHPRQIEGTHAALTPTDEEAAWARRVLDAVATAGEGAVQVDGAMVDRPVILRAQRILHKKEIAS